jgi:hypothetical protein
MRHSQGSTLPAKVEQVREQLERWRRTRPKRSPIPEAIWGEAACLARECGVSVVSKVLRLNYPDLKRRAQTAAISGFPTMISPPTFVELACGPALSPAPCVVEMEHPAGVKMKISLSQPGSVDLAALVAAFGSHAK